MITYLIKRLLGLLELFLFLRLAFKFLAANPESLVVNLVYRYSDILIGPFEFIFPDIYWPKGYLIELSTISAMLGYALLVFIIFQLLKLFSRE